MMRALVFAAALAVAPSLPHEITVVAVPAMDASSVGKDLQAVFPGATFVPMGQSRLMVISDAQTIQEVTQLVRPLCP